MIKATATAKDGRTLILLGLSHKNLEKLKERYPINIHAEEIGMTGFDIMIMSEVDEAEMVRRLQPYLSDKTVVHDKTKEKKQ